MSTFAEQLNPEALPNVAWDYNRINEVIPNLVYESAQRFDRLPYAALVSVLRDQVRKNPKNGIDYAVLDERGDSKESAVVHINPFGNDFGKGLDANMLLRAEFLRRAFRDIGVTDQNGDHLPVITLASPSNNSTIKLRRHQYKQVANGAIGQVAAEYLRVVQDIEGRSVGRLAVIGFSFGASVGVSAARIAAYESFDVTRLAVAEPSDVVDRKSSSLRKISGRELKELREYYLAGGVEHITTAHEKYEKMSRQMRGIARRARTNMALGSAIAKDNFGENLWHVAFNSIASTVGVGALGEVSPHAETMKAIERAQGSFVDGDQYTHSVTIANANHNWGDHLPLLATFYGYGLTRPVSTAGVSG